MTDRVDYIPPGEPTPADRKSRRAATWPTHRVIRFHKGEAVEIVDLTPSQLRAWEIFKTAITVGQSIERITTWESQTTTGRRRKRKAPRK